MEEYSIYFERYGYFSLFFVVALLVPAGMLFGSFLFKIIGIRKNNAQIYLYNYDLLLIEEIF